jgi:hypothetical protein
MGAATAASGRDGGGCRSLGINLPLHFSQEQTQVRTETDLLLILILAALFLMVGQLASIRTLLGQIISRM